MMMLDFYKGRRVLLTGHTGFKGAWLSRILTEAGAELTGYSLEAPTDPALFDVLKLDKRMRSVRGDVRDFDHLLEVFGQTQPEIVLHLAAQPIVRRSYEIPRETFETNVMGTVNLLEAVRLTPSVRTVVNVTTDKVYLNREQREGYREEDMLDGYDPYSNSKSCSDLVTHSYRNSFFSNEGPAISTARAGNVIGGGDFARDRIIPDCVRAASKGQPIIIRNPDSVRPFQHVLEPLAAYLTIAERTFEDKSLEGAYNVGPDDRDVATAGRIADMFCKAWGEGAVWENHSVGGPHEAGLLTLNSGKIRRVMGVEPVWDIEEAVGRTVEWSKVFFAGGDAAACTDRQIADYFAAMKTH